jgi:hypothetical protein
LHATRSLVAVFIFILFVPPAKIVAQTPASPAISIYQARRTIGRADSYAPYFELVPDAPDAHRADQLVWRQLVFPVSGTMVVADRKD